MMSYEYMDITCKLQRQLYELSYTIISPDREVGPYNSNEIAWVELYKKNKLRLVTSINSLNKENILVFITGTILNDSTSLNRFSNDPLYDRNVLRYIFKFLLY